MAGAGSEWAIFFERVKNRPDAFYQKCAAKLESQDIYEPGDLAEIDEELLVEQLTAPGDGATAATAGEVTFLKQAMELARSDAGRPATASTKDSETGEDDSTLGFALAAERQKLVAAEAKLKTMEAELSAAGAEAATSPEEDEEDSRPTPSVFPAIPILVPGNEDTQEFFNRGGLELTWKGGRKVRTFREKPLPRIVDSDLALPTLYLHFLDQRFLPSRDGSFDNGLRAGNDNSEIQLVLPAMYLDISPEEEARRETDLGESVSRCLRIAMAFLRGHGEFEISALDQELGGFGPKQNYSGRTNSNRMYFGLQAARPKAPINLDKKAWGIPQEAELYLFAQNHKSVEHMSAKDIDAFQTCIAELPQIPNRDLNKLGEFLKVFYEGGFAYNHKDDVGGKGYLPRCVGVAGLGVAPAFPGQVGISTGYPFLIQSSFLKFTDTVPVTIPDIVKMSARHGRYGLCFTRCCFVWEDETTSAQDPPVLNFCSPMPFGGFFYVPSRLRDFRRLGGLLYSFGGAKEALEVPVDVDSFSGGHGAGGDSSTSAAQQPSSDHRVCVLCLDEHAPAVMATIPCGHRAYCANCAPTAEANMRKCPVCRQTVTKLLRVY